MDLIIEWVGVIAGIVSVYLLYKNNILTWPIGFVNIGCFMWLCWNQRLFGDFATNVIFLVVGIWGWIHWSRKDVKIPSELGLTQRLLWLLATLVSIPIITYLLVHYTVNCSYPIAEASILALSIYGLWLTSLKKIESWLYWLVADFLMTIVYALKGLYAMSAYAVIIFILGILGLLAWRKLIELEKAG